MSIEEMINQRVDERLTEKIKELELKYQDKNLMTWQQACNHLGVKSLVTLVKYSQDYGFKIHGIGSKRYCFRTEINNAIKNR